MKKELSIPEQHQRRIAIATLRMTDAGALIMGGMDKAQARSFLKSIGYTEGAISRIEGGPVQLTIQPL